MFLTIQIKHWTKLRPKRICRAIHENRFVSERNAIENGRGPGRRVLIIRIGFLFAVEMKFRVEAFVGLS